MARQHDRGRDRSESGQRIDCQFELCHLFDHYADDDAVLAGDPVRFEAAYPDLVGHARQEPWFGMIEASVASSLDLTDDPDDFFHSAERCANSAATVHMLASDPQARALFLAWRFPRPAGTPAQ
ncbi:hypothetical protein B5G54_19120 [Ralstonia solanacearum]|nr:hypothetical protein CCY86_21410 [Ralstonia solanacearum]OPK46586.1 hypothetical protein B5G54_19120 [Ralstonia solanacearum]OPK52101.1 hypothetical protein B5J95_18330 [Ralstonia solanacearum]OPK53047.1 hypothetical protein B5S37_15410 [Ralstonia solanacearum]OYQ02843.1 hypothetical protein B7R79_22415 [Ralstonia solanacearum]